MILFVHHRYRTTGGEERAVAELMALVDEQLGEKTALLARESRPLSRAVAAAGMLRGGLSPAEVGDAVRRNGARIVHAHNLHPTLGWRSLAAARAAGARVVLHLHQYRLVCANGVCFTDEADCTRCHGRNTLPGLVHNCRGSRAEGAVYAAALALWPRRLAQCVDACVVPSAFAARRLAALGARTGPVHVIAHPLRTFAQAPGSGSGGFGLVTGRLAAEKGVEVAIDACAALGLPLVVAGEGPLREQLSRHAARTRATVSFPGHVSSQELARLRELAAVAIVPSRSAESFGLAAAEALACGLPVAASRIGALPELVPEAGLAEPGDARSLAAVIERVLRDRDAVAREGLARVRATSSPQTVARALRAAYEAASA